MRESQNPANRMRNLCTRPLILLGFFGHLIAAHTYTTNIPQLPQTGKSKAQWTAPSAPTLLLDAPKVSPINNQSWELLYFDAISMDPADRSSVNVVFFTSSRTANPMLPELSPETVTPVILTGSHPDGTLWGGFAGGGQGAIVTVDTAKNTASGVWHGTGISWFATDKSHYKIVVDSPDLGITGSITFRGIAPAHLPCGRVQPGQTLQASPRFGWANMIPDAVSDVDLHIQGKPLKFRGAGYHDKNWSDLPFADALAASTWGHTRVGPYSILWYHLLDPAGGEHFASYVAKDNTILLSSCSADNLKISPGFEPSAPTGYHVSITGSGKSPLKIELDVNATAQLFPGPPFPGNGRSFANLTAVIDGKSYFGTAVFDWYNGQALP